ncbi:HAMP domain-containing histidine kinase [Massilia cavernae]|uniref:HAMP domain-containing histidine kinase n=1 Tax=Massilia cavernae TaxID=2320864 RepID=UPI0011C45CC7|nr:HAMP domain-containing histidine kinase [Massilia cavernae]
MERDLVDVVIPGLKLPGEDGMHTARRAPRARRFKNPHYHADCLTFDTVHAAADNLRHSAETKGISLEVVCGPKPVLVRGDSVRLGQAILNLAEIAIKD